ncbi:MAG: NADH-quinone oxidoreductase subunit J, partial [Chloroflexi bacterium]|nr:NADH-quinone oxidoreductase subunit J [Chloroflexota bacterium]
MTYEEGLFYVIAAITVAGALGVVTARNVIHSALFLILALLGVAAVYVLLASEFLAIVQVLVYGGAVTILILFAMMLTRVRDIEGPL